MTQTACHTPAEVSAGVVAATQDEASHLARLLGRTGLDVRVCPDLDAALGGGLPVVVVHAEGLEDRLALALDSPPAGTPLPPAVILVAPDPEALRVAPLAFASLPCPVGARELAAAVCRARLAREGYPACGPAEVPVPARDLERVARVLAEEAGLALRPDRRRALEQAVRRRMLARFIPSARAYVRHLARALWRTAEVEALAALLSVNETHFWRHSGQFVTLMDDVLPRWADRPVRIWSAGCATGEEVYSIAMACLEVLGPGCAVEVVGTDFHGPSLARARRGVYRPRAARNLPGRLRERYLTPDGDGLRVCRAVRRLTRFERLNLAGQALGGWVREHGPFQVIFCRNTMIYFAQEAASHLVDHLVGALAPEGALFLGASETIWPRRADLEPVRARGCFYYRRVAPGPARPEKPGPAGALVARRPSLREVYRAGLALLDAEDFDAAEERFAVILEADPDDPRGHTGMALLRANAGLEVDAASHLERACRVPRPPPEALYLAGLLAERAGDDLEALRRYREALDLDPGLAMAHVNRAWILRRWGRAGAFREEMEQGLAVLRARPGVPRWMTGGMDGEALVDLMESALADAGRMEA